MKKILLLLAASLVLFACQKDGPQEAESVTAIFWSKPQEYTCPKCGAKYSVTCVTSTIEVRHSGPDWTLYISTGDWTVTDESGQKVSHYEYKDYSKMYFSCTCGENSEVFKKDDFESQGPSPIKIKD